MKKTIKPGRGRKKATYRSGGFWKGYNRLMIGERKKFINYFMNEMGIIDDSSFYRMLSTGTTFLEKKEKIENIFSVFGITENIWDNEN